MQSCDFLNYRSNRNFQRVDAPGSTHEHMGTPKLLEYLWAWMRDVPMWERHKHPILYRALTLGNKPRTICITEEYCAGHWEFLMTSVVKTVLFSHLSLFYMWDFILSRTNCGHWLWRFLHHLLLESHLNLFTENSQTELFSKVMLLQL